MFRRRFLMAVAAIAAAGFLTPGRAEAGFSLQIIENASINATTGEVTGGTVLSSGSGSSGTGGSTTSASYSAGGLVLAALAQTNSPGNAFEAFLMDTTIEISNTSGVSKTITFLVSDDGFTLPGQTGDKLFYFTSLNALPSGTSGGLTWAFNGPNDPALDVYTRIVSTGVDERTQKGAFAPSSLSGFDPFMSPTKSFIRGSSFTIQNVVHLTLQHNQKAQITARSTVVTPAPATAVLALAGAPVLGLFGWMRRRKTNQTLAV